MCVQLNQALAGKFNAHVHVEYEWCLQHEDMDESDEDLDEKVRVKTLHIHTCTPTLPDTTYTLFTMHQSPRAAKQVQNMTI